MTLVLHIGLLKTASTHLQKHVFPNLMPNHQFAFGQNAKHMLSTQRLPNDGTILLSAEAWSNSLRSGGYRNNFHNFLRQISRLKRTDIKIIFFIRDHEEWLISAYLQLAKASLYKPSTFPKYIDSMEPNDISWCHRLSALHEYPTLVCKYEAFLRDPATTITRIADFIGTHDYSVTAPPQTSSHINVTPNNFISLGMARTITLSTEFPDLGLKKLTGRRYLFGGNGRDDFGRVWARDKLVSIGNEIRWLRPIRERFRNDISADLRSWFAADMEQCDRYAHLSEQVPSNTDNWTYL